jgi:hypothetical protein
MVEVSKTTNPQSAESKNGKESLDTDQSKHQKQYSS